MAVMTKWLLMNCGALFWLNVTRCGFGLCYRGATCRCWLFMWDGAIFKARSRCGSKCHSRGKAIWSSPMATAFISHFCKRLRFSTVAVSSAILTPGEKPHKSKAQTTLCARACPTWAASPSLLLDRSTGSKPGSTGSSTTGIKGKPKNTTNTLSEKIPAFSRRAKSENTVLMIEVEVFSFVPKKTNTCGLLGCPWLTT